MTKPDKINAQSQAVEPQGTDASLAAFVRFMTEKFADEPEPSPKPEPWVDKPRGLQAAEAELFRCEMAARIACRLCGGVAACKDARCRRSKRCREMASFQPLLESARARLAIEQAKAPPPPAPPPAPARRRRAPRSGRRARG